LNTNKTPQAEIEALKNEVKTLQTRLRESRQKIAALQVVHDVAGTLTSELNLDPLLKKILAQAVQVMQASAGSLLLVDDLTDELVFAVIEGGGGESLKGVQMNRDQGIAGWVVTHREPLIVDDVNTDNRHYQSIANSFDYRPTSLLCAPMISHSHVTGVLQVMHNRPGRYFGQLEQQLLTTFGNQAAIAVENARLYESLKEERDHLVLVEEEIRKRLARDLHDGPTQLLASIVMSLSFTKQLIEKAPEYALDEINQNVGVANKALKQLRTLLFDLRPVILETQGLIPALQMYSERLNDTENLDITLTVDAECDRLNHHAEVAIFSIIQEAINNAKKYARTSRIDLIVRPDKRNNTLSIFIKDHGQGFDVKQVKARYDQQGSLGLINMQERAEVVQGRLKIQSEPGHGTTIILTLPLLENLLQKTEG
jgi:signal transduction histidine kinase